MKKRMLLAVLLGVLLLAGNSFADFIPIKVGDQIYVDTSIRPAGTSGGPFLVKAVDGSYEFKTFCIEGGIFLGNPSQIYTVQNISWNVITGGSNNTNDPSGFLSYAAAAIYSDWLAGKTVFGATDADYQNAIWFAEKETGGVDNLVYQAFKGATGYNNVYALNINFLGDGESQSLLVKDPVPEPISMLLFGTGLVAAGGYVRRRMKK